MSIPPLVCSTPPPPDQCEDDKDHEDFDLSYSLSQEDDEDEENNDFNFSNFSPYSNFKSTPDNKPIEIKDHEISKHINPEIYEGIFIQNEIGKESEISKESDITNAGHEKFSDINENKLKCEEDVNVEDLNLIVEEQIVIADNTCENENSYQNGDILKELNIPCSSNSQEDDNINISSYEHENETATVLKESEDSVSKLSVEYCNDTTLHETTDIQIVHSNEENLDSPVKLQIEITETIDNTEDFPEQYQQSMNIPETDLPSSNDDDFGEFDDFQFANIKTDVTSIVDTSNPWENDGVNESDFGNFTANFEENTFQVQNLATAEPMTGTRTIQTESQSNTEECPLEDDDFGDFDDFKSSTIVKQDSVEVQEENVDHELPVLNLHSTDNECHIMESINKVLSSVFHEEIEEPSCEFEGKLESLLSETWGHLMEIDERQPYIVNWNNSLGQKTLLKALCIDSRNILFGPKWTSHMPKYAANLSNAPLQPQKQITSPVATSEVLPDKVPSKSTWSDPFTSDGQESCNTDSESTTISTRPSNLDVFEAAISTKSEKIFSSTIPTQPIRQISLPDTHIFTPTDSEIPRSKTIHYDHSPSVLMPQPVVAETKNATENVAATNAESGDKVNTEDDNEYWEFQDFKSTTVSNTWSGMDQLNQPQRTPDKNIETAIVVNALPKPNIAYQTQLLQPIKVESSMPTLNWPDPGEVKVAYDDFADFVSIPSHPDEKSNTSVPTTDCGDNGESSNKFKLEAKDFAQINEDISQSTKNTAIENVVFDDDFDTFKSAFPSNIESRAMKTSDNGETNQIPIEKHGDAISQPNSVKSETFSFETAQTSNDPITQNAGVLPNTSPTVNQLSTHKNSIEYPLSTPIQASILQPTPASFSTTHNQRTTGQILQPLSLESYSQINWPSPGIDLQDLSRFNPVETLQSLKSDSSVGGLSKTASPIHTQKNVNQVADDDMWGDFVSSKPKQQAIPKKHPVFAEDDEWTDFISSPNITQNGLNTISLNVHTNSNVQKGQSKLSMKSKQTPVDIPSLNYITPKSHPHKSYNDKHFQNL